jgi:hypothetical protein
MLGYTIEKSNTVNSRLFCLGNEEKIDFPIMRKYYSVCGLNKMQNPVSSETEENCIDELQLIH